MKKYYALVVLFTCITSLAYSQACEPGYIPNRAQDCRGAIPLCNTYNRFPDNSICGPGAIPDEIPLGSCLLTNERYTTWYQFQVRTTGKLQFVIRPTDVTDTVPILSSEGDTDYDWAVFKLTGPASAQTCTYMTGNISTQKACNYSGLRGSTGMWTLPNPPVGKFEIPINVNTGEYYVLAVDCFSRTTVGYSINFADPATYPGSARVASEGRPGNLDTVTRTPTCYNDTIIAKFDNGIRCGYINLNIFTIKNTRFPSRTFDISSIDGVNGGCSDPEGSDFAFKMQVDGLFPDSNYILILNDTIRDICGNLILQDTINFIVPPYAKIQAFVNGHPDSLACPGYPVRLRASILRTTAPGAIMGDTTKYTYQFFSLDGPGGLPQQLQSNGDSIIINPAKPNRVDLSQRFGDARTIPYRVIITSRTGCVDTAEVPFKFSPVAEYASLATFANNIEDSVVCGGIPYELRPTRRTFRQANGPFTYLWYSSDNGGPYVPLVSNGDSITIDTGAPHIARIHQTFLESHLTNYRLVIVPRQGCTDTSYHTFRVTPVPNAPLNTIPALCFGQSADFKPLSLTGGDTAFVYLWGSQLDTAAVFDSTSGTLTLLADTVNKLNGINLSRSTNDTISVQVRALSRFGGCSGPLQKQAVVVGPYLKAGFNAYQFGSPSPLDSGEIYLNPINVFRKTSVILNGNGAAQPVLAHWSFGDGKALDTLGTADSVLHNYATDNGFITPSGRVSLLLSATLPGGKVCEDSVSTARSVNIAPPVIPNVITINADGTNDFFQLPGIITGNGKNTGPQRAQITYSLKMYNRWGRVAYSKDPYDNTFDASGLSGGIYYYLLKPSAGNGATYKGWIELVRTGN